MKSFQAFVIKEFKHIYRDKRTLIILFGMPVVLVLMFGFAIRTEISNAKVVVVNKANDSFSSQLITQISSSSYFDVVEVLTSDQKLDELFKEGDVKLAVIIPENFEKKLQQNKNAEIQIVADATDPNTANILNGYLQVIFNQFVHSELSLPASKLNVITRMMYNPENKSVFMFVPGVMTVILMLVSAMMTSITVAKEKELGTMEILLVSPLKPIVIILGKIIPYLVLALLIAITILLLGLYVFEVPMKGSYTLLFGEIFLFVTSALVLGLLISTISNSQQTAMLISLLVLMLPSILLSGFIFPISSMPLLLQIISNVIPAKWFIIIIKNIMLKGTGIEAILYETGILILIILVLVGLTIRKFKIRLE